MNDFTAEPINAPRWHRWGPSQPDQGDVRCIYCLCTYREAKQIGLRVCVAPPGC
jgi:hypothetical protein